jgi:4-amino-4-deoxy-L-arabinose transferase-like glycosyltransferase
MIAASFAVQTAMVGLIAIGVRIGVMWATRDSGGFYSDMADYHLRAQWLVDDSIRGPGYPMFLAALYQTMDPGQSAARLGNALLGGATAAMTCVLAASLVSPRAAVGAGLIAALYPAAVLSSVYVMPEGLYGALVLATLLAGQSMGVARSAATGILAGLTALTRSLGVGLAGAVAVGHLARTVREREWRRFGVSILVLTASCLLTLLPWFRHTTRVSGGVMLDSSSAFNVLIGANPRAQQRLHIPDGDWVRQTYFGGTRTEADRNQRALQESWRWIREHPAQWLGLVPAKIGYLYGLEGREHAWAYSNSYFGERSRTTVRIWSALLLAGFPPLALLAVVGLLRPGLLAHPTGVQITLFLAATTALHGLSFSETRYHVPLVPLLAILAARGAAGAPPMTRARWIAASAMIAGLVWVWWGQLPELLESYTALSAPDGWKGMRPF